MPARLPLPHPPGRPGRRAVTAGLVVAACLTAACSSPARPADTPSPTAAASPALRAAIDAAVAAGAPGYLARVDDGGGAAVTVAAGVADRATGRALGPDDQFEIGSITKTFMATLALQLVAEKRLQLTDTVERWLPGTVPGGDRITVHNLLQHTSGLFNYTKDPDYVQDVAAHPTADRTPEYFVAVAVRHAPSFAPGDGWEYSNTNYVLVGMILHKATGTTPAALVAERIARPLGLHRTMLTTGAATDTGPGYAHGYLLADSGAAPSYTDVSAANLAGWGGTAGGMLSTSSELFRFFTALLGGKLLPAAQLAQLKATIPALGSTFGVPAQYGLGLVRVDSPCGTVWGHAGDTLGHHSGAWFSEDGRRGAVTDASVEADPRSAPDDRVRRTQAALDAAGLAAVCTMNHRPVPPA